MMPKTIPLASYRKKTSPSLTPFRGREKKEEKMLRMNTYSEIACTGEVLSVLVKGDCHNSVSGVEGFFNTVTMVNVDINI